MAQPATTPAVAAVEEAQGPAGEITGIAQPGDKVIVTQGQTLIGETVAGLDGTWRVPIPNVTAPATPYHIRILPAERRGADDTPEEPVTILVSVTIGASKVEVRVQVTSPNGRVEVDVLAPLDPVTCDEQGPNPPDKPAAEPVYHQVKSGETVARIAARYGVTTQAIVQANKLRSANLIYVGQRLLIPSK